MNQPITVHITDVMAYKACRRAWHWGGRYRSALEPIRPNSNFFIGRAVHYVIEQLRSNGTDTTTALTDFLKRELQLYAFAGSADPDDGGTPNKPLTGQGRYRHPDWTTNAVAIRKDVAMIRSIIEVYSAYSKLKKNPFADAYLETLAHELKFGEGGEFPPVLLRIKGKPLTPHVYLAGTLDGLSRLRRDGTVWIEEYKTCRDIDERAKLLQHDEQATAYSYAAGEILGEPVSGVIYTLMRKKIPSQPKVLASGKLSTAKAIDTTVETFRKAIYKQHGDVSEDFIGRNYGAVLQDIRDFGEPYIARVAIDRAPAQIENYIMELHQTALEMHDPRTPLYANRTYSCPGCSFRQPCLALDRGEEQRLNILLQSAYRTREVV